MAKTISTWQWSLLPLMVALLLLGAFCFAIVSISEFYSFKSSVLSTSPESLSTMFNNLEKNDPELTKRLDFIQFKSLVLLEESAIKHRYAQANATIMARAWTRFMGFTTGMILAIVGASFILGKLQERPTELTQDIQGLKLSLATSSPGIVLATLGVILLAISLLARFEIDVHDVPVFLSPRGVEPTAIPDFSTLQKSPPSIGGKSDKSDPRQGGTP